MANLSIYLLKIILYCGNLVTDKLCLPKHYYWNEFSNNRVEIGGLKCYHEMSITENMNYLETVLCFIMLTDENGNSETRLVVTLNA